LFNVPSCVLVCVNNRETRYPVSASRYIGKLEKKNEWLSEALSVLEVSDYTYEPPSIPGERSIYYGKMRKGANMDPRCFWFIEFDVPPKGLINVREPAVKTSPRIGRKPRWGGIELRGNVESNFIYVTLLGGDIVRFGYTELRPLVLPAEPSARGYNVLDVKELINNGLIGITNWLEKIQQLWETKATKRSIDTWPRVVSYLDSRNKLSSQNSRAEYIVLWNASGTNLASCVINKRALPPLEAGKTTIRPIGFIADNKSYVYETDDEGEAHYLCAILNSNVVNESIKPFQPKGLYGEREIGRRPFMFNILEFKMNNPLHARLVELSKLCHVKVSQIHLKGERSASARKKTTELVKKELQEIDSIVGKMF